MERLSKFIMLVGLPASGKSTLSETLKEEFEAVILSSDQIREELSNDINNQTINTDVFEVMNSRANELLINGTNVIYDATNLNRKRRKHLVHHVIKANEKVVYLLNTTIDTIRRRNEQRDRKVPNEVIDKMYKTLQIPVENEGWDEVIFINHPSKSLQNYKNDFESLILSGVEHDKLFDGLSGYLRGFREIINLPQDSTYHSFSVSRHTYYVYKYILDNYHEDDKLLMLWAALFHDTGKAFCKSFVNYKGEETKYAHFIGHEFVSSQIAASNLNILGYDEAFIKQVVALVQFHMVPMGATEKKMKEVNNLIGEDLYNKLLILHEADMQAK